MVIDADVYVIEDNVAVCEATTLSLQKRGYSVASFQSAASFLDVYSGQRPACIVLDLNMPGMNGLALQKELSQRGYSIPIIFVTGHGDVEASVTALKQGAVDFIEKPYAPQQLAESVKKALADDAASLEAHETSDAAKRCYSSLTKREQEVMALLVAGAANASNKQIARELGISHRTVDTHRARIMEKMQARSVADLVSQARICGVHSS